MKGMNSRCRERVCRYCQSVLQWELTSVVASGYVPNELQDYSELKRM
jgi:hypothetical protein